MSTDLDVFGSTAVTTHSRRDDGFTANITGSSSTAKRISIRGGKFRLMVNGKEVEKSNQDALDVVIVNASPHVHRMYFSKAYVPGEKMPPPTCWTSDSQKPDEAVVEKQAESCLSCPQNIKGSGANGTKACRFSRRIAVVRADDMNGDVYQMTLPSQSIFGTGTKDRKPLHEYTDYVKANGENLMSVVSRVSFDEDSSSTKVGFKPIRVLSDEEYAKLTNFLKDCLDRKKLQRVKDVTYDKVNGEVKDIPALHHNKQSNHFTLKNTDKHISTTRSLAPKKVRGTAKNVVNYDSDTSM